MLLDELVREQDDKTIIGIGSKSAYFFFGTKAEYEEKIDKFSDDMLEGMLKTSRTAMSLYRRKFREVTKAAARGEFITYETLDRMRTILGTSLRNAAMAVRFVPLREREVKESYPGILTGDVKIIVEGDENSCFWTEEEYRASEMRRSRVRAVPCGASAVTRTVRGGKARKPTMPRNANTYADTQMTVRKIF